MINRFTVETIVTCVTMILFRKFFKTKANLRDLIAATGLVILLKFDPKSSIFQPAWPWNLMDDLKQGKSEGFDSCDRPSNLSDPSVNSNWSYSPETPNLGQIWQFLEPCDLEIWWMTLKNNRAPLLCYFKLCASFRSNWWIQTGATVRKRPIWVKFDDF